MAEEDVQAELALGRFTMTLCQEQGQKSLAPAFIYGTAWKEERTRTLTEQALQAGFRAIDTANQRKHYCEAEVGAAIAASGIPRDNIFLQTKFAYLRGQDHRLPYDSAARPSEQVRQSMASSLEHLRISYVDSYLLHGPSSGNGWNAVDQETWTAMEEERAAGRVRVLGVSNVSVGQLEQMEHLGSKPDYVQNRCLAEFGWDAEVRAFCRVRGIVYQGFWLLTGNAGALRSEVLRKAAARLNVTPAAALFAFARSAGIVPLTGTSSREHMLQDLESLTLSLNEDEMRAIE